MCDEMVQHITDVTEGKGRGGLCAMKWHVVVMSVQSKKHPAPRLDANIEALALACCRCSVSEMKRDSSRGVKKKRGSGSGYVMKFFPSQTSAAFSLHQYYRAVHYFAPLY